jgi:hypothetical protein
MKIAYMIVYAGIKPWPGSKPLDTPFVDLLAENQFFLADLSPRL